MTSTILKEELDLTESTFDRDNRTLRNVVLIRAGMSKNRRNYSQDVLMKAVPVFEGAKAYDGHDWGSRKVTDITGWYSNVRFENGAIHADRTFSSNDAGRNIMAVVEDIVSKRAPKDLAGLSINATGEGTVKNESDPEQAFFEVSELTAAESVDDVTMPAAGGAYLVAGEGMGAMAQAFLKSLTYEDWQAARPDLVERFKTEWKTARQSDTIKAKDAEIGTLKDALASSQKAFNELKSKNATTEATLTQVRREAMVDQLLAPVKLSKEWKEDLRERMLAVDPTQWVGLLDKERKKAESVIAVRRPRIEGAAQQVAAPQSPREESLTPAPDEDASAWLRRLAESAQANQRSHT